MTALTLITSLDEKLVALLPLVTQTLEKLLRLQLDEKTEPQTLQIHTRAVAVQNASLRSLAQLRKQLINSPVASLPIPIAPPPAVSPSGPLPASPSETQNSKLIIQNPSSSPPPSSPSPRPSSSSTHNSEPKTQNAPSASPTPHSEFRIQNAPLPLPSPDPRTPISGALLKNDPIFSNPSASVSGKILPPPRPPLNWFHNQPRTPAKKPR